MEKVIENPTEVVNDAKEVAELITENSISAATKYAEGTNGFKSALMVFGGVILGGATMYVLNRFKNRHKYSVCDIDNTDDANLNECLNENEEEEKK